MAEPFPNEPPPNSARLEARQSAPARISLSSRNAPPP
jgi:hypothetical protein